jgi:hypothetical protein
LDEGEDRDRGRKFLPRKSGILAQQHVDGREDGEEGDKEEEDPVGRGEALHGFQLSGWRIGMIRESHPTDSGFDPCEVTIPDQGIHGDEIVRELV